MYNICSAWFLDIRISTYLHKCTFIPGVPLTINSWMMCKSLIFLEVKLRNTCYFDAFFDGDRI